MKSIKYFPLTILLSWSIITSAQQYTYSWPRTYDLITVKYSSDTVYTPNNSPVIVMRWKSGDWTSNTKSDMVSYYQSKYSNRLTFESEATVKYNCHTWVWAGGTTYWMDPPEQKKYFSSTDRSYVPTTNTDVATKVWYGGNPGTDADHSANTTSTSDYFSSKWGLGLGLSA